jgi:xanthine dehydrogenase YagS FAD-binding subunit
MNQFDIALPSSVEEALALLAEEDANAVLLAGGQDLLTELKEGLVAPATLIDLSGLEGLDGLEWAADGSLTLGPLVTLEQLADDADVRSKLTVLAEAAESIASPQIRTVGTLGGNLNQRPRCWYYRNEFADCLKKGGSICYAKNGRNKYNAILGGGPSYIVHPSDLAPALVALDARVELTGPSGKREVAVEEYYFLPSEGPIAKETVRKDDELLTAVRIPAQPAGLRSTYLKFKERASYDWALSAVALAVAGPSEALTHARLCLGGVAPKPWRTPKAEAALVGSAIDAATIAKVREAALAGAEPLEENGYKVPLTQGLLTRALQSLA